jgi:hypothetical protein
MKTLQYILLFLTIFYTGCILTYPYYTGMKYNQWERFDETNWLFFKNCVYTSYTNSDTYTFKCNWTYINEVTNGQN